jgi:hypothetical protein
MILWTGRDHVTNAISALGARVPAAASSRLGCSAGSILTWRWPSLPEKPISAICDCRTRGGSSPNNDARREARNHASGGQFQYPNCCTASTANARAGTGQGSRDHLVFVSVRITHVRSFQRRLHQ